MELVQHTHTWQLDSQHTMLAFGADTPTPHTEIPHPVPVGLKNSHTP
jgi:hypothetical protein